MRLGKRVMLPQWRLWLILGVVVALPAWIYHPGSHWYWLDLVMTRDQQGWLYYQLGDYRQAAQRFQRNDWRALSFYAAEEFNAAARLWAQIPGATAHFNRANALAHGENYVAAADGYRLSLQLQPEWQAARDNLDLAEALSRKAKPLDEEQRHGGSEIGADKIVFDAPNKPTQEDAPEVVLEEGALTSEQINALWLRRLSSTPADFLRLKFGYQVADRDNAINPESRSP